jgi:hypothetical protein
VTMKFASFIISPLFLVFSLAAALAGDPPSDASAQWSNEQCSSAYITATGKLNQCLQDVGNTIRAGTFDFTFSTYDDYDCGIVLRGGPNSDPRDVMSICQATLSHLQAQYKKEGEKCMAAFEDQRAKLIFTCPNVANGSGPLYCGTRRTVAATCEKFFTDGDLLFAQCSKWLAPPTLCSSATLQVGAPLVGEVPGCHSAYESTAPLFAACANDPKCLSVARGERFRLVALCLGQEIPPPRPKTGTSSAGSTQKGDRRTTTTLSTSVRPGANLPRNNLDRIELKRETTVTRKRETTVTREKSAPTNSNPVNKNLDRLLDAPHERRINRPTQKIY